MTLILCMCDIELPEDFLVLLEKFWAEEYEADYHFFINELKKLKLLK